MPSISRRLIAVLSCPYPLSFVGLAFLLPYSSQIHWLSAPLLVFGVFGYGARSIRRERVRVWKNWLTTAIGVCLFLGVFQYRSGDLVAGWLLAILALVLTLEGLQDMDYVMLRGRFDG